MDNRELIKKIEDYKENVFLFDWLTITSTIHDAASIMELIGISPDMFTPADCGRYGYAVRTFCGGISILSGGFSDDMGVCLEMSGQGCRDFETLGNGDFINLFRLVLDNPNQMKITRLDIAYDIHDGSLNFDSLKRDVFAMNWVSFWKKCLIENELDSRSPLSSCSFRFGSRQSEMFLRFYDKAAERGIPDLDWKRCELVLKRDRALEFVRVLSDKLPDQFYYDKFSSVLSPIFWGVMNHYLRFVKPDPNDSNKSRWPMADWWASFIQSLQRVSLFVRPGIQYNLHQTQRYVFDQAGNSALTLIMCCGFDAFVDGIIHRKPVFSQKFRNLAAIYGCDDNIDISVDKLNQLSEMIAAYKRDYNLQRDRWIECEGSTPFDAPEPSAATDPPLPSFEQMVMRGFKTHADAF